MGGPSNNASSQNAAAQQQVGQNTQAAQANLAQWLAANPSVLQQSTQPIQGAPQMSGAQGGGVFGGGRPNMPHVAPQGASPQAAPAQGQQPQGAPQIPPGLLALLGPQRQAQ